MIYYISLSTDLRINKPILSIEGHIEEVNSFDINPYNEYLIVSGSSDNTISLWDMRNLSSKKKTFIGHTSSVNKVLFSNVDSDYIFSLGGDSKICIWSIESSNFKGKNSEIDNCPKVSHIAINYVFLYIHAFLLVYSSRSYFRYT
jgi:histone-binding protein RBBP4